MDKPDTLLTESRVRILCCDELSVYALVNGNHADYHVSATRDLRECDCDYRKWHPIKGDCSHVRAVLKVWKPEPLAPTSA